MFQDKHLLAQNSSRKIYLDAQKQVIKVYNSEPGMFSMHSKLAEKDSQYFGVITGLRRTNQNFFIYQDFVEGCPLDIFAGFCNQFTDIAQKIVVKVSYDFIHFMSNLLYEVDRSHLFLGDVKPSNIFILPCFKENFDFRCVDLGMLSRELYRIERTFLYCSIEEICEYYRKIPFPQRQVFSDEIPSDNIATVNINYDHTKRIAYAVGVILYEIASGGVRLFSENRITKLFDEKDVNKVETEEKIEQLNIAQPIRNVILGLLEPKIKKRWTLKEAKFQLEKNLQTIPLEKLKEINTIIKDYAEEKLAFAKAKNDLSLKKNSAESGSTSKTALKIPENLATKKNIDETNKNISRNYKQIQNIHQNLEYLQKVLKKACIHLIEKPKEPNHNISENLATKKSIAKIDAKINKISEKQLKFIYFLFFLQATILGFLLWH